MSGKFLLLNSFLIIFFLISTANAQETVVYRNAVNITDPIQRVAALKDFINKYPQSYYKVGARFYLFYAYSDLGKTDSALIYASRFVNTYPAGSRLGAYVDVAEVLAEKKAGLDTADVYSAKAVKIARQRGVKRIGEILDTRARILNLLGHPDSALVIEKEVIASAPNNPDYLNNISGFEAGSGKIMQALNSAAKAILMGNYDDAVANFNKWAKKEKPGEKANHQLRNDIVKNLLDKFFKDSKNGSTPALKSQAAVFLAKTGVEPAKARKYSLDALNSLNNKSSLDDKIAFTKNYALVLSAENHPKEALKELTSIEKLVDPWDSDFWYTLGQAYENNKDKAKAARAYLSGMTANPVPKLKNTLKDLGYNEKEILSETAKVKKRLENFEPGRYKKPSSYKGNVVLAELFTGAECPPCAGADFAFDALQKYYPRNVLAVLEYHVHIPAPDPMTNPQTFKRYLYYGGNFGTPTAIFEGTEKITGGGPKFLMENRFHVYQYSIDKFLKDKSHVSIKGGANLNGEKVAVSLIIKSDKNLNDKVKLHIALAEKTLKYPGGNGVTNNIFVVRALSGKAEGISLDLKKTDWKLKDTFDIKKIEKNLKAYLDNPQKYPSWRPNARFKGWRQRTDKINSHNLAVVVWLQNNKTKKVLQAYYMDVKN